MRKNLFWLVLFGLVAGLVLAGNIRADNLPQFFADEVVITGSAHEESLEKSASSVTVLKVEQLKKKGINYLDQALSAVSGADIKASGFLGGLVTINLRGSRSEQILVLLDGKKINSPQNGVVDLSAIPLDNLERIEIVKFPLSALYGADALGGVVNLISRSSRKKQGEVNLQAGGFGEKKYLFGYQDIFNGCGYRVNLNLIDSDGFRNNSDFHGRDYSFSLNLPENFGKALLAYAYQKNDRGVPGSLVYPSESARQNDENNLMSANFSFELPKTFDNQLNFYFNQFWQTYADPAYFSFSNHRNRNAGFDYLNSFNLFDNQTLTSGVSYRREGIISTDVGEHNRENLAVLMQDEIQLLENFGVVAGGRLERFSTFGKIFTPRIGSAWKITPDLNFKSSWSRGYRVPTFNELYWPESPWAGGNPDLKPEEGEAYDFELTWMFGAVRHKLGMLLGKTFNMINWAADSAGVWRPQNLVSVDRKSVELGIEAPFCCGDLFTNFSWQNVTDTATGFEVTYLPHYKANAGVHLKNSEDSLGGDLTFRYVGWRFADNNNFAQRVLPSFLITDLKSFLKINNWTLRAGVNNLFDVQYQEIADYPAAGRSCWASMGVEF